MKHENQTPTMNARGRSRVVYAGGAKQACANLLEQTSTRSAGALLEDFQRRIHDANWISWGPLAKTNLGAQSSAAWVGSLWHSIDNYVAQAIEQCEVQLASCQIATLKVTGHSAAGLARAILEQHRTCISGWTHQRSVLMSEDEYDQWRAYVACGVELHNQTAVLLHQARPSPAQMAMTKPSGVAEIAVSCLGSLLLQGQVDRAHATRVVSLVADFVELSKSTSVLPATVRPAWDKVGEVFESQQPGMPSWEVLLLFPRRFLLQTSLQGAAKDDEHLKAMSEANAMRLADDYERLAASLRFTPALLECVTAEDAQLPIVLSLAYRTAKASLLASASLLRAVYRRQAIHLGDEEGCQAALAELTESDMQDANEEELEPASTYDWSELANRPAEAPLTAQRVKYSLNDSQFCEVCFRSAGSRKFCSLHLNTGGKSRHEIKEAQQFIPHYRNALVTLRKQLSVSANANQAPAFDAPSASFTCPPTLEALQNQSLVLLAKHVRLALWGVEQDRCQEAQQQIEHAAASIEAKILNVSVTPPIVWAACAFALADLEALSLELETLRSQVDLLADSLDHDPGRGLLGNELRLFSAAYTADILCRIAALCANAQAITLLPEDIRRDFYTQWLNGYKPLYSLGHQPNTQARDPGFIQAQFDKSAFSALRLWEHFARLAAWRKAQQLPPVRKARLRRLSRDVVMSLRKDGMSVEQMAQHLDATAEGVRAALLRWDAAKLAT